MNYQTSAGIAEFLRVLRGRSVQEKTDGQLLHEFLAQQLLETLAKGIPNPRVAQAAAAALRRLANQMPETP